MGTRAETTRKEKAILKFIEEQVIENGYPPSVREIGKAIGLSSTATVHAYLAKLEKQGYIKKEDKKGRTLKVIKGTDGQQIIKENKNFYTQRELVDVPVIRESHSRTTNPSSRKCYRHIPDSSRFSLWVIVKVSC